MTLPLSTTARASVGRPPVRLRHLPGARLCVVLWGGLAVVDVWGATGSPSYVGVGALALLVAACSLGMRPATAVAAGAVACLLANGFVVHRLGVLAYDGPADLVRLAVLVLAGVVATRVHR